MAKKKNVSRARLQPGESTVDRANIEKRDNALVLRFTICHWDGRRQRTAHQEPLGTPLSDVRRKAKAHAQRLLEKNQGTTWQKTSSFSDYLKSKVIPSINDSDKLQPTSKKRYILAANQLVQSFKGYAIRDAASFDVAEKVLKEIAKKHGKGAATSCKTVLAKYTFPRLVQSGYIPANPLANVPMTLPNKKGFTPKKAGLHTLTKSEWDSLIQHLVARDTSQQLDPKAKRVRQATRNIHERICTLTVIQAITGLRINEAVSLQWEDFVEKEGSFYIDLPAHKAKGKKKGRVVPLISDEGIDYLVELRDKRGTPKDFIAGQPSNPSKKWDATNADDFVPEFYKQVSEEIKIPTLKSMTSHDWRATLNGIWAPIIGTDVAAAIFGHSEKINREYYTDGLNVEAKMADAKSVLDKAKRKIDEKTTTRLTTKVRN